MGVKPIKRKYYSAKTGETKMVEEPNVEFFADLPKEAPEGIVILVKEDSGIIGLRKLAGYYVMTKTLTGKAWKPYDPLAEVL